MNIFFSILAKGISLLLAMAILVYFDTNTLFLATLLTAIVALKYVKENDEQTYIDKLVGIGFALSVSPSVGVAPNEITLLANGFIVQSLLSFTFFLYFIKTKPSIIGRISREAKAGVRIIGDDVIAGFAAGVMSSIVWQAWLQLGHIL